MFALQPDERIIHLQTDVKNLTVSGSCQLLYLFRCETAFFLFCDIGQEFFFSSLPFFFAGAFQSRSRGTRLFFFFFYFSAFFFMASEMVRGRVRIYVVQHPGYRIESKYISLGFAAFGRSPDVKHSRASAFQFTSTELRSVNICLSIKMKTMVEDVAEVRSRLTRSPCASVNLRLGSSIPIRRKFFFIIFYFSFFFLVIALKNE